MHFAAAHGHLVDEAKQLVGGYYLRGAELFAAVFADEDKKKGGIQGFVSCKYFFAFLGQQVGFYYNITFLHTGGIRADNFLLLQKSSFILVG